MNSRKLGARAAKDLLKALTGDMSKLSLLQKRDGYLLAVTSAARLLIADMSDEAHGYWNVNPGWENAKEVPAIHWGSYYLLILRGQRQFARKLGLEWYSTTHRVKL